MSKILINYFSCSGQTKEKALDLAKILHCDCEEIKPVSPYTAADLNWRDSKSRSTQAMQDEKCRPEIKDLKCNVDEYNLILLGFPIWWGIGPREIETYLDKYNFQDKKIILFATSGGSQMPYCLNYYKKHYENYNFLGGVLLNFSDKEKEILALIEREGIN